jgi:hypothetical protein
LLLVVFWRLKGEEERYRREEEETGGILYTHVLTGTEPVPVWTHHSVGRCF